jgi:hypothetical protein
MFGTDPVEFCLVSVFWGGGGCNCIVLYVLYSCVIGHSNTGYILCYVINKVYMC